MSVRCASTQSGRARKCGIERQRVGNEEGHIERLGPTLRLTPERAGLPAVAGRVAARQDASPGELCADGVALQLRLAAFGERAFEVRHGVVVAADGSTELADRVR